MIIIIAIFFFFVFKPSKNLLVSCWGNVWMGRQPVPWPAASGPCEEPTAIVRWRRWPRHCTWNAARLPCHDTWHRAGWRSDAGTDSPTPKNGSVHSENMLYRPGVCNPRFFYFKFLFSKKKSWHRNEKKKTRAIQPIICHSYASSSKEEEKKRSCKCIRETVLNGGLPRFFFFFSFLRKRLDRAPILKSREDQTASKIGFFFFSGRSGGYGCTTVKR